MTRITTSCDGTRIKIEAEGHATGSEVVCGIVSAVLQGLRTEILSNDLWGLWDLTEKPGHVLISAVDYTNSTTGGENTLPVAWHTVVTTLLQVAAVEPEYLSVTVLDA